MRLHGSNISPRVLIRLLMLVMLFGIPLAVYAFQKKRTSLNFNDIYSIIKNNGFRDPLAKYVLSQAAHETSILGIPFQSSVLKNNNNLFGMTFAGQRIAAGEKNGFALYYSIDDSVTDLVDWYNRHRSNIFSFPLVISSLSDYVSFLKNNNYFEASESEYLKGCEYFYKQFFS